MLVMAQGDTSAIADLTELRDISMAELGTVAGIALAAVLIAVVAHAVLFYVLGQSAKRSRTEADEVLVDQLRLPARFLFPFIGLLIALPSMQLDEQLTDSLRRVVGLMAILMTAWMVSRAVRGATILILKRYDVTASNNRRAREVHTRVTVISRIGHVLVMIIGVAAGLMVFPTIRQLGASILASAGISALIIGLAAQRVLGNFLAGLQIALTQPIRIDDVVVIRGEWGRIEEITSTYVVVRIWDERRLVVPFSTIIEEPFENWTRDSSSILGTVYLHVDYTMPVGAMREKVREFAEQDQDWDGRVAQLVVTDAEESTLRLRALVSAASASQAWDMRCRVREKLIDWLQREHPECLPVQREIERHHQSVDDEKSESDSPDGEKG